MISRAFLVALSLPALAACAQFPELDHTQTTRLENADYPALIPIEPILARADAPRPDLTREESVLNARLAALRARADRMRGTVLSGAEKQRLENGLK
jgi:hypothetical protein